MKKGKSKHVCEYENSEICMSRSLSDQGGQRFHYTSNQNSSSLKGSIIIDITISAPIGTQKLRITISGLSAMPKKKDRKKEIRKTKPKKKKKGKK